jgi:hypothetical protein
MTKSGVLTRWRANVESAEVNTKRLDGEYGISGENILQRKNAKRALKTFAEEESQL